MSQSQVKRAHVSLDTSTYETIAKLALQSPTDRKISVGALIAAAVFCGVDKLGEKLPKKFTLNKVKVDKDEPDKMEGKFTRMQVYFGKDSDLYEKVNKLAKREEVSVSWVVRKCCQICLPVFAAKVPKGKNFKCLGKEVTID